jgi:lysozyme family protein
MNFEQCLVFVLDHEGGDKYTDDPHDPGGPTRWGIAQNYHPGVDVKNLTLDGAEAIYRSKYWNLCRCDELPAVLRLAVFDAAVNPGLGASIKFLQRVVNVDPDGAIGARTIAAAASASPLTLSRILTERILYYGSRSGFNRAGRGWVERCMDLQRTVLSPSI